MLVLKYLSMCAPIHPTNCTYNHRFAHYILMQFDHKQTYWKNLNTKNMILHWIQGITFFLMCFKVSANCESYTPLWLGENRITFYKTEACTFLCKINSLIMKTHACLRFLERKKIHGIHPEQKH